MDEQPCHCLLCQDPPAEDNWDERDRGIAANVRQFGWTVIGVTGESLPDWMYSIGIWHTLRGPEICVFGLPAEIGTTIVNAMGALIGQGVRLEDGEPRDDILNGYDIVVREVHPHWYQHFFGAGIDFYQRPPMPMMQVLWPDRDGLYPWDPEADESCRRSQPSLWLPPAA